MRIQEKKKKKEKTITLRVSILVSRLRLVTRMVTNTTYGVHGRLQMPQRRCEHPKGMVT